MEKEKCQREIEEMQKQLSQLSPTPSTFSTLQVNFKKVSLCHLIQESMSTRVKSQKNP